MTRKEWLSVIDKIDDKYINELADYKLKKKQASEKKASEEDELVVKPKYYKLEPLSKSPLKKVMIAIAAVVCVAAVGIFIGINKPQIFLPNDNSGTSLDNLDLSNAKIIENTPDSGKWQRFLFDFQKLSKQSADRIVNIVRNYGAGEIDKNDIMMRLSDEAITGDGKDTVPLSEYDDHLYADNSDFPYISMYYLSDDIFVEVQSPTGGLVELDNRRNVNSVLDLEFNSLAPWRPVFYKTNEALVDLNDESATCVLNGKTVKIVDAIKNAEKFVSEHEGLFPKTAEAKIIDATLFTYENGNQSLALDFEYTLDGVLLDGKPSTAIDDENGVRYKSYCVHVQAAMLTESTLDWIWFPALDGGSELKSEECEIKISREKACELVSKKLSRETKFHVKEIQLMYGAQRTESGKLFWEPTKSLIEPKWRFSIGDVQAQEFSSLYVYVSAVDGTIQISKAM